MVLLLGKWRYEPRLRATPRKRVVYEPRALFSATYAATVYGVAYRVSYAVCAMAMTIMLMTYGMSMNESY